MVAAQLWSFVHGFITLELADAFVEFDDPVRQVLLPMGVNLSVGLGDTRERAQASHETAARRYDSIIERRATVREGSRGSALIWRVCIDRRGVRGVGRLRVAAQSDEYVHHHRLQDQADGI